VLAAHRTPFVMLLCGLLGGALVSALVISTTLAEGSFQISKLQSSTSQLAKQQQTLEQEVAQAQSPQQIAQRAAQLGMRRTNEQWYIDLATGKTTDTGQAPSGTADAPGIAP
jgi:outer membrane murein-binding lipoprotein Lpp